MHINTTPIKSRILSLRSLLKPPSREMLYCWVQRDTWRRIEKDCYAYSWTTYTPLHKGWADEHVNTSQWTPRLGRSMTRENELLSREARIGLSTWMKGGKYEWGLELVIIGFGEHQVPKCSEVKFINPLQKIIIAIVSTKMVRWWSCNELKVLLREKKKKLCERC